MDTIVLKVSDLYEKVKEIKDKGMDYVELFLSEAQDDLPAAVNFTAMAKGKKGVAVGFEEVEATEEVSQKPLSACLPSQ